MSHIFMLALLLTVVSPIDPSTRVEAPAERAYAAFASDPARRFDFWIGEWDVNLRTLQADQTFEDWVTAHASIYSILDGKAILELWDSKPIKGFSLRYYDEQEKKWKLWLDWPQPNRSSLGSLSGAFRHGRGVFRDTSTNAQGQTITQVYSFSDITPFSLRWDDMYSADGGKSWTRSWVMEFTRTAVDPRWPIRRKAIPTYADDGRCDDERFRGYELLVGRWRGEGKSLEIFPVLDGCAVIGFLDGGADPDEFIFVTFDSRAEHWVTAVLDDRPETGLERYAGSEGWVHLSDDEVGSLAWTVVRRGPGQLGEPGDELHYRRGDRAYELERIED